MSTGPMHFSRTARALIAVVAAGLVVLAVAVAAAAAGGGAYGGSSSSATAPPPYPAAGPSVKLASTVSGRCSSTRGAHAVPVRGRPGPDEHLLRGLRERLAAADGPRPPGVRPGSRRPS